MKKNSLARHSLSRRGNFSFFPHGWQHSETFLFPLASALAMWGFLKEPAKPVQTALPLRQQGQKKRAKQATIPRRREKNKIGTADRQYVPLDGAAAKYKFGGGGQFLIPGATSPSPLPPLSRARMSPLGVCHCLCGHWGGRDEGINQMEGSWGGGGGGMRQWWWWQQVFIKQ